jgi:hypothetical protein
MAQIMKTKLIAVIVVSVVLVATGIWYFAASTMKGGADLGSVLILGAICLFALLAVAYTISLKLKLEEKMKLLDEPGRAAYEAMSLEIRGSPLSGSEKRDLSEEILDILISAQAEGKGAESIVGKDPVQFVRGTLESYGVARNRFLLIFDSIMYFLGYLAGFQVFFALRSPGISFFSVGFEVSLVAFFGLISVAMPAMVALSRSIMGRRKAALALLIPFLALPLGVGGTFIVFIEIVRANAARWPGIDSFLRTEIVVFPDAWILAFGVALFGLSWFMKRRLGRRRLSSSGA